MQNTSLLAIFLTGLTTGGLTCLAIQGSLLTSIFASASFSPLSKGEAAKPRGIKNHFLPILSFLISKIVTHTLLGFLLGILGTSLKPSPIFQGYFQIALGLYLFGITGNLLNLHPLFRYFVLTPPRFILKYARKISQDSSNNFTPAILGVITIFLPCATTQAIEVLALTTQNPIYSAAMLFFFVLGTTPTFLVFGFLLNKGQTSFQKLFPAILGIFLLAMSLYTVNAGISLTGSVYTFQNFWQVATNSNKNNNSVLGDNIQTTTINVTDNGYSPNNITLKKNVLTKLELITTNVANCSRSFTIPSLNISKLLPETGTTIIEFTPKTEGPLAFSCSMGMYTGKFNIIN